MTLHKCIKTDVPWSLCQKLQRSIRKHTSNLCGSKLTSYHYLSLCLKLHHCCPATAYVHKRSPEHWQGKFTTSSLRPMHWCLQDMPHCVILTCSSGYDCKNPNEYLRPGKAVRKEEKDCATRGQGCAHENNDAPTISTGANPAWYCDTCCDGDSTGRKSKSNKDRNYK
jgi:hypothetical protein